MAFTFGFYDSVNGDRTYSAKEFSQFFDGIITDGVFENIGGHFNVTASSGMTVNVASGRAWLNKKWLLNDAALPITIDASEPMLNRIDSIVFVIDEISRTASISVLKGTPASSPVQPVLTNTADHFEYRIADVYVGATVTSITNANITNYVGQSGLPYVVMASEFAQFSNSNPIMDGTASPGTATTLSRSDHKHPTDTSRAPIASPTFTGTPKAPTAAENTTSTQIATTAFVMTESAKKAPKASPTFTGTANFADAAFSGSVTVPTQGSSDNSTKVATTAFVKTAISGKANLASPGFSGTPTAPTAAVGTNTTQIATTAFVHANPRNTIYVAKCTTATGTADKVATIEGSAVGFSLASGVKVAVHFTNGDYASTISGQGNNRFTLNVNNTGAKEITTSVDINGSRASGTGWGPNDTVIFTYTGSGWKMTTAGLGAQLGFNLVKETRTANRVFASPNGSSGVPTFRALVAGDIPTLTPAKINSSGVQPNSLIISGANANAALTYREMIHLTAYDGKIPASADGTVPENAVISATDTRVLTAGSLARIGGRLVPRNVGGGPGDVMWRLSRIYTVDYFNNEACNPSINGMIHFYYE